MSVEQKDNSQMSDGFAKSRAAAVLSSGILLLANLGIADLSKPFSYFGFSIPDPNLLKAVLCVVASYNVFRMVIEWFQSNQVRRSFVSSKIDFAVSLVFSLFAMCWYLLKPLNLEILLRIPFLPMLMLVGYGFYYGQIFEVWATSYQYLRSKEEALRLGLHRLPFAVRCMQKNVLLSAVPILVIIAMSPGFSEPLSSYWIYLLFVPALISFLGGLIDMVIPSRRTADGRILNRKEYIAGIRRAFEWHDVTYQINGWDGLAPHKHSELYDNCEHNNFEKVKKLVESGVPINLPERHRWTPLMIAVAQQHMDIIKYLLEKGANPNTTNSHGRTPLAFAALYGNKAIVELLLKYGANPNFKECSIFEPPLEAAARSGNIQIVEILLKAGADPAAQGIYKKTPLQSAEVSGHGKIAATIRSALSKKQ
jgi:hypothetical protein